MKINITKSGIYAITSLDGNCYIGGSTNTTCRVRGHFYDLKKGTHNNRLLQAAYCKYGRENFNAKIVIVCRPVDLLLYEQITMNALKPHYNIAQIAGSSFGLKRPMETCARISAALKGKKRGPHTKEHRAKISAANKGKKKRARTLEERIKISLINKGKKLSEEHKAKISAALKGRVFTPEWRNKISAANKRRHEDISK